MGKMLVIKERNVDCYIDYILQGEEFDIQLWAEDWNGEIYTEATYEDGSTIWGRRYRPVYDGNNEIIGFEEI